MSDLSEHELLEIRNEIQNRCNSLFQELENNDLITSNPIPDFDPKTFTSWLNADHLIIGKGLGRVIANSKHIIDDTFSEQDFVHFAIYLSVHSFVIQIEQLKDAFVSCLDKDKLNLKEEDSLGNVIHKINQKINLSDKLKELFFLDFRNAIVHRRYTVHAEILTYILPNEIEVSITIEKFSKMKEQFGSLVRYIVNYEKRLVESKNTFS